MSAFFFCKGKRIFKTLRHVCGNLIHLSIQGFTVANIQNVFILCGSIFNSRVITNVVFHARSAMIRYTVFRASIPSIRSRSSRSLISYIRPSSNYKKFTFIIKYNTRKNCNQVMNPTTYEKAVGFLIGEQFKETLFDSKYYRRREIHLPRDSIHLLRRRILSPFNLD